MCCLDTLSYIQKYVKNVAKVKIFFILCNSFEKIITFVKKIIMAKKHNLLYAIVLASNEVLKKRVKRASNNSFRQKIKYK